MKTFLGNISVQKKKNHLEICLGTGIWLWFWINGLISSSFSTYIFPDIKRNRIWLCFKWFVLFGAKDWEQTLKHFFLSEIIEKLMQNNLINEMLLTSKYLTLSPEKKTQPGSCWISLFSVLRKMIILSRQTWKEGEYFALLILLETNNLFGKWCLFMLFLFCIVK